MKKPERSSGLRGVHWYEGKWSAVISRDGYRRYLGRFDSKEETAAAYNTAAELWFKKTTDRKYKFRVSFAKGIVEIPLTQGKFAIIDTCDAERVLKHRWWVVNAGRHCYAQTTIRKTAIKLHRFILQPPPEVEIDHVNRNGLDNRRSNLRRASRTQNKANSRLYSNNRSGFKGVSWNVKRRQWRAQIKFNGHQKHLGCFKDKLKAAAAYDKTAHELFGEFTRPNGVQLKP